MMQLPLTFVIVPAYNEEWSIAGVVAQFRDHDYVILVVDDGSQDGTARQARGAGAKVVKHPINLGQGAALQTGIDYALKHGAAYIVTFDADGQHQIEDIEKLLQALQEKSLDIVFGSRFLGTAENIPTSRRLLLKAALCFMRLSGGPRMSDVQNGLRAFHSEIAPLIRIHQPRMAHASEILYSVKRHALSYAEVPITVRYTEYSQKKGQRSVGGAVEIVIDLFLGRNLR